MVVVSTRRKPLVSTNFTSVPSSSFQRKTRDHNSVMLQLSCQNLLRLLHRSQQMNSRQSKPSNMSVTPRAPSPPPAVPLLTTPVKYSDSQSLLEDTQKLMDSYRALVAYHQYLVEYQQALVAVARIREQLDACQKKLEACQAKLRDLIQAMISLVLSSLIWLLVLVAMAVCLVSSIYLGMVVIFSDGGWC